MLERRSIANLFNVVNLGFSNQELKFVRKDERNL